MSTVQKLEIRGIRSFGIDKDDAQKINFQTPLTLIVGQNGCGKTTIIECLKYALTGEVPPGTSRGQSFVHDPKIFGSAESLGQVKLMVEDFHQNKITCVRSMKTIQKKNTVKFETLDGTVTVEAKDGKRTTLTKRCADVNIEMSEAMGVSKSIINNVIFCHQEDSNWPLDEGKKLKEKFDAIFGTTEYNKAIEKLIKLGKVYSEKQRQKVADLRVLEHIKDAADAKNLELSEREAKYTEKKKRLQAYEADTKPVKDRLEQIDKIMVNISKLIGQKIEMETNLKGYQKQENALKAKIKNVFVGGLHMLEREISTFNSLQKVKNEELFGMETSLSDNKKEEKIVQDKIQKIETRKETLILKRASEQEFNADRAEKIKQICGKLNIPLNVDIENSNEAVDEILILIQEAIKNEDTSIENVAKAHENIDNTQQSEIDKLRVQKAKAESEITSIKNQIAIFEREKITADREINNAESSAHTLKAIMDGITKLDKELETLIRNTDLDKVRADLLAKKESVNKMQKQSDKLDEEITFLTTISNQTTEISIKEKMFKMKEAEFKRIKNKNSDNLKRLFSDRTIENNFKRAAQNLSEKLQKDVSNLNNMILESQSKAVEMKTKRENHKKDLEKCEKELRESEEKLYNECNGIDLQDVLSKLKDKMAKNQLDHGASKSAQSLYKKYISKINDEQCCPVCHKELLMNEITDVNGELSDEIVRLPEKIEMLERQLKQDQVKYDRLLALKPYAANIEKLKLEIPQLKTALQTTQEALLKANNEVEEYRMSLAEPNSNLHLISSMHGDMAMMDEATKEMSQIENEIEKLKSKLPSTSTGNHMSLEDAQIEKVTLASELKLERARQDSLQEKINDTSSKLNTLNEKRNKMKATQIKLQENVQSLSQTKKNLAELIVKIENARKELNTTEQSSRPLQGELNNKIENKRRTKEENRKKFVVAQTKVDRLKSSEAEIARLSNEIRKLAELNLVDDIRKLGHLLHNAYNDKKKITEEIEQKTKKIDKIKTEISNQTVTKRDLEDNLELKKLMKDEEELQSKLDSLKQDIGDMDHTNLVKEKDKLKNEDEKINNERSKLKGQIGEIENRMYALKKELAAPEYKNALENYHKTNIGVFVAKKIVSDLIKYRNALEGALMKFHTDKMNEINRSIQSLWREIYRGNDIDYIKIKTDEFNEKAASDKRRVYNYRVVQAKNNNEIDMRGRCSAGQKVLASLIIRMALAETFCSQCAVLALDEPTTNLDQENIESLCESLRSIVNKERNGRFMLIVITHDEKFIRTLEGFETFYRISRNNYGKSVIVEEQL